MTYHLDTNAVIAILRDRPVEVRARLRQALDEGASVALSSIVVFELWYGVARSQQQRANAERLGVFLSGNVEVVPLGEEAAQAAGRLRAALEAQGTPIGPFDLLIAAQALASRATLVTSNVSEFARVRELAWVDWAVAQE
ncbi:MAG: hypothetical protein HW416_2013 [Chloroflexi bacterium]|nr:hypothetical protein [Chloroflexota bacterium]